MSMKREALAVILISIIVIAGAIWLFLSQTNQVENQVEDQTFEVKMVDFNWTSNWGTGGVGLLWGRSFNITLQNLEKRDIEGLSIEVKLLANNTEIPGEAEIYGPGIIGYTVNINYYDGRLNASETRELRGYFETSLDKLDQAQDWGEKSFTVGVMMDDIILDEIRIPF